MSIATVTFVKKLFPIATLNLEGFKSKRLLEKM